MLLQAYTNKFYEVNKKGEVTHLARPQQSTIVKAPTAHHYNRLRTYGSRAQEPPEKTGQIRVGY